MVSGRSPLAPASCSKMLIIITSAKQKLMEISFPTTLYIPFLSNSKGLSICPASVRSWVQLLIQINKYINIVIISTYFSFWVETSKGRNSSTTENPNFLKLKDTMHTQVSKQSSQFDASLVLSRVNKSKIVKKATWKYKADYKKEESWKHDEFPWYLGPSHKTYLHIMT